jgi:hypothetical protein
MNETKSKRPLKFTFSLMIFLPFLRMRTESHLAITVKPLFSGVAGDRRSVEVSAHGSVVMTHAKFTALALVSNFFTSVLL